MIFVSTVVISISKLVETAPNIMYYTYMKLLKI